MFPRDMVCLRNTSVDTLHKRDTEDDNNDDDNNNNNNNNKVQSKMRIGNTFENDIKELDPRKAYKYLGIEEKFDIQHKNEKEELKKEYLRRLRISFGYRIKCEE